MSDFRFVAAILKALFLSLSRLRFARPVNPQEIDLLTRLPERLDLLEDRLSAGPTTEELLSILKYS